MILVLTSDADTGSDRVEAGLRARGAEVVRFDPGELPVRAGLSITYRAGRGWQRRVVRTDGAVIDLDHVSAVWVRRPQPPRAQHADARVRRYLDDEWRDVVADLWTMLGCAWCPAPPAVIHAAQRKAHQLVLAGALGFTVPDTAVSSLARDFAALHDEHDGDIITKLASPIAFAIHFGAELARYTERADADGVWAPSMRHAPIIIQQRVAKRVEVRVTVVGDRVFAAEIHSQARTRTRDDWRRYDLHDTPHTVHDLPAGVAARCVALVQRLGLRYGAIDLVVTPEDDYVFLEINPSGEFGWIEELTGLPIADAICDLLVAA